jgi:hypothetical protein
VREWEVGESRVGGYGKSVEGDEGLAMNKEDVLGNLMDYLPWCFVQQEFGRLCKCFPVK